MSICFDANYKNLLGRVMGRGKWSNSRAGRTKRLFAEYIEIDDLMDGFPILTLRKLHPRGIFGELAAFISGATQLQAFKDFGCNYWDANAAAWVFNSGIHPMDHLVGQSYGYQWRHWPANDLVRGYDQLRALVSGLKRDPDGRRHILLSYNPSAASCLPACYLSAQYFVDGAFLDCCVTMRSVDLILGLPSDVVLHATLQHLLALECNLIPRRLVFNLGDTHIYESHMDGAHELMRRWLPPVRWARNPSERVSGVSRCDMPHIVLHEAACLFNFHPDQVELINYEPQPAISGLALNV